MTTTVVHNVDELFNALLRAPLGSIIEVAPGTYEYTEDIITGTCPNGNPPNKYITVGGNDCSTPKETGGVTLRAQDPQNRPIIRGQPGGTLYSGIEVYSNCTIDGLIIENFSRGISIMGNASNIIIQNCTIHDQYNENMSISIGVNKILIQYCDMYNAGRRSTYGVNSLYILGTPGPEGCSPTTHDITIRDCCIHGNLTHSLIDMHGCTDDILIDGCTFYDNYNLGAIYTHDGGINDVHRRLTVQNCKINWGDYSEQKMQTAITLDRVYSAKILNNYIDNIIQSQSIAHYYGATNIYANGNVYGKNVNPYLVPEPYCYCIEQETHGLCSSTCKIPDYLPPKLPDNAPPRIGYTPCDQIPIDTGTLNISSNPNGATIYIDSINLNRITPSEISGLVTGTHRLLLRLTGYNDYEKDIIIAKDKITYESPTLIPTTPPPTEAPVGYWKFDETVIGTAFDSSVNAYDGTDHNTSIVPGKSGFGNARSFNGSTSYVDIGAKSGLAITDELTITALIKTTDTKEQTIVGRTISGKHAWSLATTGGKGYFWVASGYNVYSADQLTGSIVINDGNWHTLIGRWTGAAIELYVDGKLDISAPKNTKPNYDTSQIVHIGNFPGSNGNNTAYFNGAIDEVKIYNKAIAIEIPPPPPPTVTPVGYWKFEESVVGTAIDSSDNHNNGTEYNVSIVPSKTGFGNALSFNGSTSYINIGTSNSLTIVDELTISALIKTTDTKEQVIVSRNESGNHAWALETWKGKGTFWVANGYNVSTADIINGSIPINDGNWHTVVGRWTGTAIELYVDGKLDISTPKTSKPNYNTNQIVRIGNFQLTSTTSSAYFNGTIDEVKIYNKAIAIEIPPPSVPPSGYWTFDDDSASTAYDSSGNNNNGTKKDVSTSPSKIGFGSALLFNGSTSSVNIDEKNNTLTITDKLTISAIIATLDSKEQVIVGRSISGNHAWSLGTWNDTVYFWIANEKNQVGNADIIYGSKTINDGKWHTVVGRWTGSAIELYIDDVLDISKPKTSKPTANTNQKVRIGSFPLTSTTSSAYFNGIIDEVKIYNDAV